MTHYKARRRPFADDYQDDLGRSSLPNPMDSVRYLVERGPAARTVAVSRKLPFVQCARWSTASNLRAGMRTDDGSIGKKRCGQSSGRRPPHLATAPEGRRSSEFFVGADVRGISTRRQRSSLQFRSLYYDRHRNRADQAWASMPARGSAELLERRQLQRSLPRSSPGSGPIGLNLRRRWRHADCIVRRWLLPSWIGWLATFISSPASWNLVSSSWQPTTPTPTNWRFTSSSRWPSMRPR
jgi:hypothetical protein